MVMKIKYPLKEKKIMKNKKIAILGAGGWATAIAYVLSRKCNIALWEFDEKQAKLFSKTHENKKFLPGIKLSRDVIISSDIKEVLKDANIVAFAVPSHTLRSVCKKANKYITSSIPLISLIKGIENDTFKRMSEIIEKEIKNKKSISVLSGPSHAEEVGREIPTTVVIASKQKGAAEYMQRIFNTDNFRVYTSQDVIGVEIGGAVKNIIAIACGISDGMGFGVNTKAALMTRSLVEIKRLAVKLGAKEQTLSGLSGIGDLAVTCFSKYSRNRYVGERLGMGIDIETITNNMVMVAEGIYTTKSLYKLSKKLKVEMPISNEIYSIIYKRKSLSNALKNLMLRPTKPETVI